MAGPARRPGVRRDEPGRRRAAGSTTSPLPELPEVEVVRGTVASTTLLAEPDVDALVLPVAPAGEEDDGVQPRAGVADAAVRYGIDLGDLAERSGLKGSAGEAHTIHLPRASGGTGPLPWSDLPLRLVLVGTGSGSATDLRRAGAAVARSTRGLRRVVTTLGADGGADGTRAVVEGYLLGAYRHPSRATGTPPEPPARSLVLLGRHAESAVAAARIAAEVAWVARVLTVTPSDTKTPAWMAEQVTRLATGAGLSVEVLEGEQLAAHGFGGVVAVGSGSAHGPRFATVRYEPVGGAPASQGPRARPGSGGRHVVLIGKGITYDTGGISIKPRESMVAMKTDMAGAAVALAAVLGAARAGVRHRVTALLPLAENAVGASSYRPGDVVTVHGGTTVEIINTDAEGRMVLADALSHADSELDPDFVVDVATLTGAATLGLGRHHGALYSTDDRLARSLEAAGEDTGELLWRMPLVEDYREVLRSSVADVRHVPVEPGVGGGSITAALFLQRFAGQRRWAHLDIAGPARATAAAHEVPEGATGFGARLLLRWLLQLR